ncbi:MFS general substrate transporter [Xylariaceae sp. FL0255]|nr:MFS general substrate transporter [Xylariaceae sp. FL0255]
MSQYGFMAWNHAGAMSSKDNTAPAERPFDSQKLKTTIDDAKLLRKIDLHVLPILFIVYVAAFLDRVNISNALTLGLPQELGLVGEQPNIALSIFFVPYVILEIPSNAMLKKLSPHVWLSICIFFFGTIVLAQGFVTSYRGLIVARVFLGISEAGIFPGSFYVISYWYKKEDAQKRFTFYWSSLIIAGAFGGLLASAIANLNGARGLSSWRWVFIIEGSVAILIGILAFFCITDFPKEATWLTPDEKAYLMARIGKSTRESRESAITPRDVLGFLAKPKHWAAAFMFLTSAVPEYSLVYFLPTIIQGLGYSTIETQLHSVPPYAAALVYGLVTAWLSDKLRVRSPFVFLGLGLLVAGLVMLYTAHGSTSSSSISIEYAGLVLVCVGTLGTGGIAFCWYIMNLRGHVERSIGTAWVICIANIGAIIALFSFQKADAPYYRVGYSICLSTTAACFPLTALYWLFIWREKKSDRNGGVNIGDELYL